MPTPRFLIGSALLLACLAAMSGSASATAGDPLDLRVHVPESWLETRPMPRVRFKKLEGQPAPALNVKDWKNETADSLEKLQGRVVALVFWSSNCEECAEIVEELNALHELYAEDGLSIVGVLMTYSEADYEREIRKRSIGFPVCVDVFGQTSLAYKTDGTPDIYLIDTDGTLLIADLKDEYLTRAVTSLLEIEEEDDDGPADLATPSDP